MSVPFQAAGAVFLSYAREDADAARRIADALRGFGIEVWFDQNELRGGDAWDQKIRRQINDCALFIALISRHTEARAKGYFRLEWKLAVEQTHMLLEGVPFVVPVAIDDTPETAAVPPEFMRVQWTRLPDAQPSPQFVEQIKRLLITTPAPGITAPPLAMRAAPPPATPPPAAPAPSSRRRGVMLAALGVAAVLGIGIAVSANFRARRAPEPPVTAPKPAAPSRIVADPTPPAAPAAAKSIAVLPFANLSTEKDNEFFADGVQDDVITNLAKIRDLTVISRTSTLAYRDPASRNLKKIAADLGVATVLEGSIRRVGSKVHMNAQLIDARTDAHLWADTFDGDAGDIFALQANLAQKIAAALKATLTTTERALIERRPTENAEAYAAYLRGYTLWQTITPYSPMAKVSEAADSFERAVALDPAFSLAFARLAAVQGVMYFLANLDPTPARRARAEAAMRATERLAPDAPETRYAEGAFAYFCDNNWAASLAKYEAAAADLPNDALLHSLMGFACRRLGRYPDAIRYFERAVTLNPHDDYGHGSLIETLWMCRRYDQLAAVAPRYRELFPADSFGLRYLQRLDYEKSGDLAAYLRARDTLPPPDEDPAGLARSFESALLARDYPAAERLLDDPRLPAVPALGNVINQNLPLLRAHVAYLRSDLAAARRYGDEAATLYRHGTWTPRQQPYALLCAARAESYAGRTAEAVRDAQAVLAGPINRDAFSLAIARFETGRIFIAAGRTDDALTQLRETFGAVSILSVREIRNDAVWSRLAADPRFDEILRSAKPL